MWMNGLFAQSDLIPENTLSSHAIEEGVLKIISKNHNNSTSSASAVLPVQSNNNNSAPPSPTLLETVETPQLVNNKTRIPLQDSGLSSRDISPTHRLLNPKRPHRVGSSKNLFAEMANSLSLKKSNETVPTTEPGPSSSTSLQLKSEDLRNSRYEDKRIRAGNATPTRMTKPLRRQLSVKAILPSDATRLASSNDDPRKPGKAKPGSSTDLDSHERTTPVSPKARFDFRGFPKIAEAEEEINIFERPVNADSPMKQISTKSPAKNMEALYLKDARQVNADPKRVASKRTVLVVDPVESTTPRDVIINNTINKGKRGSVGLARSVTKYFSKTEVKIKRGLPATIKEEHRLLSLFVPFIVWKPRLCRLFQFISIIMGTFMTSSVLYDARIQSQIARQDACAIGDCSIWEMIFTFRWEDAIFILANYILTLPSNLILDYLFKFDAITEDMKSLHRKHIEKNLTVISCKRKLGFLIALVYQGFSAYMILIFASTRNSEYEVAKWLITFGSSTLVNFLLIENLILAMSFLSVKYLHVIVSHLGCLKPIVQDNQYIQLQ
eukprot:TRINITY_DN1156_c0_g1_i8.p1 TRINITY_DN1156_c0_g1~~TRINITY_DN1156_c0_g1_i8.p1  ORF type:complete len:553 (-),score=59.10 TRINITY_DN1156_c0_g1_i8:106-1764(-)